MKRAMCLVVVCALTVGCGPPPPRSNAVVPHLPTQSNQSGEPDPDRELKELVKRFCYLAEFGITVDEQKEFAAMFATPEEVAIAFPKHVKRAQYVYANCTAGACYQQRWRPKDKKVTHERAVGVTVRDRRAKVVPKSYDEMAFEYLAANIQVTDIDVEFETGSIIFGITWLKITDRWVPLANNWFFMVRDLDPDRKRD